MIFQLRAHAAAILTLALPSIAAAAPITFAQYSEVNPNSGIDFTVSGGVGQLTSPSGDVVSFSYGTLAGLSGLPSALQGPQSATLAISGGITTAPAFNVSGTDLDVQPINSPITVSFQRTTPFDGLTNLLTVTIGASAAHPVSIVGTAGGESAALSASSATVPVSFTSDFLTFPNLTSSSAGFSFSALQPPLTYDPATDTYFEPFTTDSIGTFSASPSPNAIAEPWSAALFGLGLLGIAGLSRRKSAES